MPFLNYAPDIERPDPDEQETIEGIIQESRTVERRDGRAVPASRAESTACVPAELVIPGDLPPELAQGLFARPSRLRPHASAGGAGHGAARVFGGHAHPP